MVFFVEFSLKMCRVVGEFTSSSSDSYRFGSVAYENFRHLHFYALRSVYTKCDFSPFCCRTKFRKIFDASS